MALGVCLRNHIIIGDIVHNQPFNSSYSYSNPEDKLESSSYATRKHSLGAIFLIIMGPNFTNLKSFLCISFNHDLLKRLGDPLS